MPSSPHTPMPDMIYGTAWKTEKTTELVRQALQEGFRGVDTAAQPKHYREELVGEALAQAIQEGIVVRSELFIQTKFTSTDGQALGKPIPYDANAPITQQVEQSVTSSLVNLKVDYIDSVLLHGPLETLDKTLEAWRTLERFVESGQIGVLGISNIYNAADLQWLIDHAKVKVSVVQNRLFERSGWFWDVIDLCKENDIRYQPFWILTGNYSMLKHPALLKLAKQHWATPEQTLYRLCRLWGMNPLCGSTDPHHVEEAVYCQGDLPFDEHEAEVQELQQFARSLGQRSK